MATIAGDIKAIYKADLKDLLWRDFVGQSVAMTTGKSEPDHVSFVIRIGHDAALHIGAVLP